MTPRIELRVRERIEPLPVSAVFTRGAAARALAKRLVDRCEEGAVRDVDTVEPSAERSRPADRVASSAERSRVSIVRSDHEGEPVLVALGSAEDLPWVDGAVWLGRDPDAPTLFLPTVLALDPHPALVASALARHRPPPIALVRHDVAWLALSLAEARDLHPNLLRSLLDPTRESRDSHDPLGAAPTSEAP